MRLLKARLLNALTEVSTLANKPLACPSIVHTGPIFGRKVPQNSARARFSVPLTRSCAMPPSPAASFRVALRSPAWSMRDMR